MKAGRRVVTLGEVATVQSGFAFKSSQWTKTGVPVVKIANVKSGRIDLTSNQSFVSESDAEKAARFRLQHGDIVIGMTGYVGEVAQVRSNDHLLLNQRVGLIQIDESKADRQYLFHLMNGEGFRSQAKALAYGSAQPNISPSLLHSIDIELPSIEEQRAIAATLGALDDKIESNRRLIELIPSLVRARADIAITKEPVLVPVSDLASFTNGGAYTKGATGTGRMVIRIAELNSGPGRSTVYNDIQVPDAKTARAGDLLMAWSGSLGVYRWHRDESIINQHIFKVVPDKYPAWLVFDRLEAVMPVFRALAADKATTMGHIQRRHLTSTTVSLPAGAAIAQLDEELAPLWERLLLAERENLRLSRLRDTLLPELLSGRLRVPAEVS